ncbi:hypothetical protein TNCV_918721 [Trichonephila clavipes]|nr:hypothetical protein TNCV_918721 [Trichonephila clavipes]
MEVCKAFDPTTSVESSRVMLQTIIMVAIGLALYSVKRCESRFTLEVSLSEEAGNIGHNQSFFTKEYSHNHWCEGVEFYLIQQQVISSNPPYIFNISTVY